MVISTGSQRILMALLMSLVGSALLFPAAPATAHTAYKQSDPADESTVSNPPSSIWAEFTEPPTEESNLKVYGPCGGRVDPGDSSVAGYRITVSVNDSHAGTYRADFDVASKLDGHGTDGSFTFTSSGGEPCPGADGGADDGSSGDDEGDGSSGDEGMTSAPGDDDSGSGFGSSGSSDAGSGGEEATSGNGGNRDPGTKAGGNKKRDRGGDQASGSNDQELTVADGPKPREEAPGIWEGIPIGGFLMAMTVAALIGAAGGRIYAGIMGPKP